MRKETCQKKGVSSVVFRNACQLSALKVMLHTAVSDGEQKKSVRLTEVAY